MSTNNGPGVVVPPPLIFIGGLAAGILFDRLVTGWTMPLDGVARHLPAALLIAVGAALIGTALGLFRRAGTRPEPWRPSSALVVAGIYRYTRNPMYLGMALCSAGLGLAFASPSALVLLIPVIAVIQFGVIAREERYLIAKFGDDYRHYQTKVRPWL